MVRTYCPRRSEISWTRSLPSSRPTRPRTFTAHEFSQNYLPLNLRDPYKQHLDSKKFPDRAIVRDTSAMGARLRRRKYKFGDDAELVASPEAISSGRVTIKTDSAGRLGGEGDEQWTQITIQHQMTDQR